MRGNRLSTGGGSRSGGAASDERCVFVRESERPNTVLQHVRNVPYKFRADQVPDYDLGSDACALFLDLKFHNQRPTHIQRRMREVANDSRGGGGGWRLRVLVCLANKVADPTSSLRDLSVLAIHGEFTLIVVWSDLEAALYVEAYKTYEAKDATTITKRAETEHMPKLVECLRAVRGVNTSDVVTLSAAFSTLRGIAEASEADLSLCPGVGPTKVQRLHDAFHKPF